MIINGKWMSETEIIAMISQLTADKKRLERQEEELGAENKVLIQECDRLIKEKGELLKKLYEKSDDNG